MFKIESVLGAEFTVVSLLVALGAALLMGFFISLIYIYTNRHGDYSKGLAITLVVLPVVISVIILLVQDSWARAFSLAGSFSIIRFRSTQGNPRDLALIFSTLAVGLSCGTGYILVGVILVLIVAIALIILDCIRFAEPRSPKMRLKITIPESLNYIGVFDDVFRKYAESWELVKVKSSNFGTMFDLSFNVKFNKNTNEKEFLDDLRCKNGNLSITLQNYVFNPEIAE